MKVSFGKLALPKSGTLAITVLADKTLTEQGKALDEVTGGLITRAMDTGRFEGKKGQTLEVVAPAGTTLDRVILCGLGKVKDITNAALQNVGGSLVKAANTNGESTLTVFVEPVEKAELTVADMAAQLGFGAQLGAYRFDQYRTKMKDDQKPTLTKLAIQSEVAAGAKKLFDDLAKIAEGVAFARDLVNEPGNVINPETFAKKCLELEALGIEVEVLGEKKMQKLGMGALLGVGQGSAVESQLVVMKWNGGKKKDKPLGLVGKGVTFDTGGISIKPSQGMEEMKADMAGAAAVVGTMKAIAARDVKANVVGVVGLVENMPSGKAQRPGDIVTSMSGQTIEVLNTDAEGRLVLGDAITYIQRKCGAEKVINLATLTGAIIIALGHEYAGLFSNNDDLALEITTAGEETGEKAWRLPLGEAYDKDIDSPIADMKNIGSGRGAGSITAAQFLQRFVEGDNAWAHIDIAGMMFEQKGKPTKPKGAAGFGVQLLNKLIDNSLVK